MRLTPALLVLAFFTLPAAAADKPKFGDFGVDVSAMDKSVKPGDNFFLYTNGNWLKTAVIPPDRSQTGSFQDLQILSETRMRAIVNELEGKPYTQLTTEQKKLRDLYDAFEDTAAIEANGLKSVQKDLDYLAALRTKEDVARAMASVPLATESIYDIGIGVDDKNPDNYSLNLNQSGLGLPDRDYYLSDDKALVETRTQYRQYLADMMKLAGMSDADARADRILALETQIAKVQWSRADRRDEDKVYNPMKIIGSEGVGAGLPMGCLPGRIPCALGDPKWRALRDRGREDRVRAAGQDFRRRAGLNLARLSRQCIISIAMPRICPSGSTTAISPSTARSWAARTQQLDRPTRGIHLLDALLGEALGKLYVARYFPPEAKAKADELVNNLLKAYEADIQTLDWMSPDDPHQGAGEDQAIHAQDRLSQPLARLFRPYRDARRSDRRHPARRRVRVESRGQPHQPAGGQDRMGHDAAHHQRLLQSVLQRDRVSRPPSCSRLSSIPMRTMR